MKPPWLVRMTTPVLALSALPLAFGLFTAWYVHHLQRAGSEALAANVASLRAAEELEIGTREVRTQLDHFLLTSDPKYLEQVPVLRQETDYWLREAEQAARTRRERLLMARVRKGYVRFFDELERSSRQATRGGLRQEMRALIDQVLTEEVLRPTHDYLDFNEEEIDRAAANNRRLTNSMVVGLLLLAISGPVAGSAAGYALSRRIHHSLSRLQRPIGDTAGKLTQVVGPVTLTAGANLDDLEGVLCRIADHTGQVVEQLHRSQREALRSEQLAAVGQLAAGMAHELRNPLMSIKLLVQAAAARRAGPGLRGRDLAVLEEEITRLERLVGSFLDFARPPRPELRRIEVRETVDALLALVARRARQQGVRIVAETDDLLQAQADPGQLRQVLLNLLLNALDAVGDGGTVWVRASADGGWLTLEVADTGRGLPARLGEQIFEPFVSTKETGLGLGLSISKRIVESHGGDIRSGDRPGGGAIFTVRLPHSPCEVTRPCPACS